MKTFIAAVISATATLAASICFTEVRLKDLQRQIKALRHESRSHYAAAAEAKARLDATEIALQALRQEAINRAVSKIITPAPEFPSLPPVDPTPPQSAPAVYESTLYKELKKEGEQLDLEDRILRIEREARWRAEDEARLERARVLER